MIWDGDGTNANAALTVFRHFDSATVVKGFVGDAPTTAWVIDYPLLERIHYLLVAGFDVYGNVAHQLATRLYMDFLRMEGEANFLMLLPPARRQELVDVWYRGLSAATKRQVSQDLTGFRGPPKIAYRTPAAEVELFPMLRVHFAKVLSTDFALEHVAEPDVRAALGRLGAVKGPAASFMSELSFVTVRTGEAGKGPRVDFTITRDSAHSNITYLFDEGDRRVKAEDALTVVEGFLGAYPNALYDVAQADLDGFVDAVAKLDGEAAYRALRAKYGVLRTSDRFWDISDRMHEDHRKEQPLHGGIFDFNRLEAY